MQLCEYDRVVGAGSAGHLGSLVPTQLSGQAEQRKHRG